MFCLTCSWLGNYYRKAIWQSSWNERKSRWTLCVVHNFVKRLITVTYMSYDASSSYPNLSYKLLLSCKLCKPTWRSCHMNDSVLFTHRVNVIRVMICADTQRAFDFSTWFIARQSSSFQQIILLSFFRTSKIVHASENQFATVRCIIYIGTFSIWLYSICRTCESFVRLVGCQTRVTNRHGSPVSAGEHPSCFN